MYLLESMSSSKSSNSVTSRLDETEECDLLIPLLDLVSDTIPFSFRFSQTQAPTLF